MVLTWDWWQIATWTNVVFDTREPVPTPEEMAAWPETLYLGIGQVLEDGGPVTEEKYVEIYLELLSGEPYPIGGVGPGDPLFFGWTYEGYFWFDKPMDVGFPSEPFRLRPVLYDQNDLGQMEPPGYEQPIVTFGVTPELPALIIGGTIGATLLLLILIS